MTERKKIYTRKGDRGQTCLADGTVIKKNSLRVSAYGLSDELNSHIGLVKALLDKEDDHLNAKRLNEIQEELYKIHTILASPGKEAALDTPLQKLEEWIDDITEALPELSSFVTPGGSKFNAHCHIARTVCRRTERALITLSEAEEIPDSLLAYFNRLSDFLFTLSRIN